MFVEDAERVLRQLFIGHEIWEGLYTDRYWHIRGLQTWDPRPLPLLQLEGEYQAGRLNEIGDRLTRERQAFELPEDWVAVVADTNIYAHYRPYDELPWKELARGKPVRLIVPLVVIDELDTLTYTSKAAGKHAAVILRSLRNRIKLAEPERVIQLHRDVELQFFVEPRGHQRQQNHDGEILAQCEHLAGLVDGRFRIATGDLAMQMRASLYGLSALLISEDLRLPVV